jgi:hypothetical protein
MRDEGLDYRGTPCAISGLGVGNYATVFEGPGLRECDRPGSYGKTFKS